MQLFNQLTAQARSLLQSMSPGSRVLAGLMLACVLVSAAFLVRGGSSFEEEYLFGGRNMSEAELDAAEVAFGNAGLGGYERVGRRIAVPAQERETYLKALSQSNALPRRMGGSVSEALNSTNFLESLEVGRQRIRAAEENDMATAICNLNFVEHAWVKYDERRQGFSRELQQTASVWVRPKLDQPLTDQQKRSIMQQVASGWAGLKYENVSIIDSSNGATMAGATDPMTAQQQRYYYLKNEREREIKTKALNLLSDFGDVLVEVFVELDTTVREATQSVKYDEKPTTLSTSVSRKDDERAAPAEGGRPGAEPNAIANRSTSLQAFAQETSKSSESSEQERKVAGNVTTLTESVGMNIKYASIAVSIPASYYKAAHARQWLEANPGKAPADYAALDRATLEPEMANLKADINKKVQSSLAALLPSGTAGSDRYPSVTITDYLDTPEPPVSGPGWGETAAAFALANWRWFAMFALAGVSLLMLRSFQRAAPAGGVSPADAPFDRGFDIQLQDPATWDLSQLDAEGEGPADEEGGEGGKRRFQQSGSEIKAELTQLVRDNPDAAASLLRNWIGDAA